jgi:signal transduction histidine kinase
MKFRDLPIQRKLMVIIVGTSGVVLLLTCTAFLAYDVLTFRRSAVRQLSTLGEVIAANSTAVLAFDNVDDATEVLGALKAERHIVVAALYDKQDRLFARYPAGAADLEFPAKLQPDGYRLAGGSLVGFTPVVQVKGSRRLGTLYLRSDMEALNERLKLYGGIAGLIVGVLSLVAYALSRRLQQQISRPILALAETARAVSTRRDYSVRAGKPGEDEIGLLTDAFNHMLEQIEERTLALQRSYDEVEARVRDRTAELEKANNELEAFASSVSHDLRTPLRAITGLAEILLKSPAGGLTDEARRCVGLIHRGSCEMDQLIDSIMAFSRLGHQAPTRQSVDLEALSAEVFRDLAGSRPAGEVEFHVQLLAPVSGDPALLRQVLVNLLANALKFSRRRHPAIIEVGMMAPEEAGEAVYFVRDNGVGFDMDQADRLFGMFQRLYHPEEFEGSGVGLAMVRRIIERHGGRVWAESEPGAGATFYFALPTSAAELP